MGINGWKKMVKDGLGVLWGGGGGGRVNTPIGVLR